MGWAGERAAGAAVTGWEVEPGACEASSWALRNSFIASPAFLASLGSWLPPNSTTTTKSTHSQSVPKIFASNANLLTQALAAQANANIVASVRSVALGGSGCAAGALERAVKGQGLETELFCAGVLECVANLSEGRDQELVASLAQGCGRSLLDVHSDPDHNRSVFTLAGPPGEVERAVAELASSAVRKLDLRRHSGVHPRFGVLDVVPWVGLDSWPLKDAAPGSPMARAAEEARARFARFAGEELELPTFLYGPERSLPEVRRRAWKTLAPDFGPPAPHPSAGSAAVGLRPLLVAYNLWMAAQVTGEQAREVAASLRGPAVRSLALPVRGGYQVSCNLVSPFTTGPADVFDQVSRLAPVKRAEVVGLVPEAVLSTVPEARWAELGLSPGVTIESRLVSSARERR